MSSGSRSPAFSGKVTPADLDYCVQVLEAVLEDPMALTGLTPQEKIRLIVAAGKLSRPDRIEYVKRAKAIRNAKNEAKRAENRAVRSQTSIRETRVHSVYIPPPRVVSEHRHNQGPVRTLTTPDYCYICKQPFTELHHFYDSLCPNCAAFNYEKRFQSCSLEGKVAVITGARLKIGYQAALMMLRAGARVIVTTRFPKDAALRYSQESDFEVWRERLQVYGLDLRHSPSVECFCQFLGSRESRLDILINNAAQTVRRPPGFYGHLLEIEQKPAAELAPAVRHILRDFEECKSFLTQASLGNSQHDGTTWISEWHQGKLPAALGVVASAQLSQIPYSCDGTAQLDPELFPKGNLDADLQQVDLRSMNSWRMTLAQVPTAELLEVQLVNSIAPYILCSKLKPLMLRDRTNQKHVVNVSAMEGKFSRHTKTDKHPHTNMAKAALNMMTLTSARDFARDGIYMNAVDTGWVTDEDPIALSVRKQQEHDFQPPLDIVDGAARVMDPIFSGLLTGNHAWGNFLKDYVPTDW